MGLYVMRAADRLSPRGLLVVTLKHPETPCNDMLEAFGAPRFNLLSLTDTLRRHPELTAEWVAVPGPITTSTFEETYAIARFMLNDRPASAYARSFTTERVEEYVRQHFWDEAAGVGGWRLRLVVVPDPAERAVGVADDRPGAAPGQELLWPDVADCR